MADEKFLYQAKPSHNRIDIAKGRATTKAPLGCSLGEPSPVQPSQAKPSPKTEMKHVIGPKLNF